MPSPANSISIAAGGLIVTGHLTQFVGFEDDTLFVAGRSAPIASFDSTSQVTLKVPVSDAAIVDAVAWSITKTGPDWSSNITVNSKITTLLAKIDAGLPLKPDAVGTLAQRANYDAQGTGFLFLQSDHDPFLLYAKRSNASGDWTAGQYVQGTPATSTQESEDARDVAVAARDAAAQSASSADTSRGLAQTAAGASQGARDQAQTLLTTFRDSYYGPSATNPATRPDGTARQAGDIYYNTAAPGLRIWTGSTWSPAVFDTSGALVASANLSDVPDKTSARKALILTRADGSRLGGIITNPCFDVNQRYTAAEKVSVVNGGLSAADQWSVSSSKVRVGVTAIGSPFLGAAEGERFFSGHRFRAVDPWSAPGAADYLNGALQGIEGVFARGLGWGTASAKPIKILIAAASPVTGTYTVAVKNSAGTRAYVTTVEIPVANVPTYFVITVPGCTDGVWDYGTGAFLFLSVFSLSGTQYQAPSLNQWQNGPYVTHASAVNWAASASNYITLACVNVFPGDSIPFTSSADPNLIDFMIGGRRDYTEELTRCKRYLEILQFTASAYVSGGADIYWPLTFAEKRTAPTWAYLNAPGFGNASASGLAFLTERACSYYLTATGAGITYVSSAQIELTARV